MLDVLRQPRCRGCSILLAFAVGNVSCSSGDRPAAPLLDRDGTPSSPDDDSGVRPEPDAAASPFADAGEGGDAGVTVPAPDGGIEHRCGDGIVHDESEECDGENFAGLSCAALGFGEGELGCSNLCELDLSACIGVEVCHDNRDNDGDTLIDCLDEDCVEACASSCDNAVEITPSLAALPSGVLLNGSNAGHASEIDPTCSPFSMGPEVVYRLEPLDTGVVSVELTTSSLLVVSIRESCDSSLSETDAGVVDTNELACGPSDRVVSANAVEGEPVFVVVDGRRPSDQGSYALRVSSRAIVCGDGFRDGTEACDDGNTDDDDGCTSECALQVTETEPNDDIADSSAYENPFLAQIDPSDDVDVVSIDLDEDKDRLVVRTLATGDNACAARLSDTVLVLMDAEGNVLAEDDDGGEGTCSSIEIEDVEAGTYYAAVSRAPFATPETFPYRLSVLSSVCGDGVVGFGELCDDGNTTPDDGCGADCR